MADSTMNTAGEALDLLAQDHITNHVDDISMKDPNNQATELREEAVEHGEEYQRNDSCQELNAGEQADQERGASKKQELEEEQAANEDSNMIESKETDEEQIVSVEQEPHNVTEAVKQPAVAEVESQPSDHRMNTEPGNDRIETIAISQGNAELVNEQTQDGQDTAQLNNEPFLILSSLPLEEEVDATAEVIDLTDVSSDSIQCLDDPAPHNNPNADQGTSAYSVDSTFMNADAMLGDARQRSVHLSNADIRGDDKSHTEQYQNLGLWGLPQQEGHGRQTVQQITVPYNQPVLQQAVLDDQAHVTQGPHSNPFRPPYTSPRFHRLQRDVRAIHPEWSANSVHRQAVAQYERWAGEQQHVSSSQTDHGPHATYYFGDQQQAVAHSTVPSYFIKQDPLGHLGVQGMMPSSYMPSTNMNNYGNVNGFNFGSQISRSQPASHTFYRMPTEQDFVGGTSGPVPPHVPPESSSHTFNDTQASKYAQGYQFLKNKHVEARKVPNGLIGDAQTQSGLSNAIPFASSRQAQSPKANKFGFRGQTTKPSSSRNQPEHIDEHDCGNESDDVPLRDRVGRHRSDSNDSVLGGPDNVTGYDPNYVTSLRQSKAKPTASLQPRPSITEAHAQTSKAAAAVELIQAQGEQEAQIEQEDLKEDEVVYGSDVERAAIDWKLPTFEAIYEPGNSNDAGIAKVSVPGLVREEIMLSPDHEQQEVHLLLNVFLPFQQKLDTPDPEPAVAVLNFHTVALMVVEAFTQFEIGDEFGTGRGHWHGDHDQGDEDYERLRKAKDADTDEIFFDVMDRWRAALASGKEPCKLIRGVREFCDIALDVIDYIKEHGLLGEKEQKATVKSAKRAAPKVNQLQSRKKAKTETSKGKGSAKKKGPAVQVIKKSKN